MQFPTLWVAVAEGNVEEELCEGKLRVVGSREGAQQHAWQVEGSICLAPSLGVPLAPSAVSGCVCGLERRLVLSFHTRWADTLQSASVFSLQLWEAGLQVTVP